MAKRRMADARSPRDVLLGGVRVHEEGFSFEPEPTRRSRKSADEGFVYVNFKIPRSLRQHVNVIAATEGVKPYEVYVEAIDLYVKKKMGGED